jgi:DNA-binding NarL/FixJ family response regulator
MESIPILVADEHLQVRSQIVARLTREADFNIVGVANDSSSAVRMANDTHPRIVLIDPMMRDGMGLDAIRHMRTELPDTVIVVLAAFTDTAQKIELGKLGVHYILNKGIESYKLVRVLHAAADPANGSHSANLP